MSHLRSTPSPPTTSRSRAAGGRKKIAKDDAGRSLTGRVKVVKATPSKTERKRLKAIRDRYQKKKPTLEELTASSAFTAPLSQEEYWQIAEAGRALKQAREDAQVTLATVAKRSGIDQAALSRLERGVYDNPTIATLSRYARALGKDLVFKLADAKVRSA